MGSGGDVLHTAYWGKKFDVFFRSVVGGGGGDDVGATLPPFAHSTRDMSKTRSIIPRLAFNAKL